MLWGFTFSPNWDILIGLSLFVVCDIDQDSEDDLSDLDDPTYEIPQRKSIIPIGSSGKSIHKARKSIGKLDKSIFTHYFTVLFCVYKPSHWFALTK